MIGRLVRLTIVISALLVSLTVGQDIARADYDSGPARVYFPQTGHHLDFGFLDYWRQHGGLAIFGYPLSEEVQQDGLTVQYFERAVFEWHPDATWRVQLRALGNSIVQDRQSEQPFENVSGSNDERCTFYTATEHKLCAGFRDYWENHGGLRGFGYPLSEEFTEDGFTVQYFERARFEWHPGSGGVLLGQLGFAAAIEDGIDRSSVPQAVDAPNYDPELWTAPEPPNPPATTSPADLSSLEQDLRSLIQGWEGQNAVSITDLQTGERISINGDRRQLAACTIKIPIMVAVAQDIEAGKYTRADVEYLVLPAMGPSLTPPAKELIRIIGDGDVGAGVRRVNAILRQLGAKQSIMTHPPGYFGEEYGYLDSQGITSNYLTTDDLNTVLANIYRGDLLSPEMTDYVLWSLTIATPFLDGSMKGPLPSDARVYHKIGVLYQPWNTWNDAGIVVFNRNGQDYAYAIAFLAYDNPGTYKTGYWHGYTISDLAWKTFNGS